MDKISEGLSPSATETIANNRPKKLNFSFTDKARASFSELEGKISDHKYTKKSELSSVQIDFKIEHHRITDIRAYRDDSKNDETNHENGQ